jgi:hypothetical protein
MKKAIILYFAWLTIAVVLQGCCGKIECIPHIDLRGGVLRVYANGSYVQNGTHNITGADTLKTELDFLREFISKASPGIQLIQSASAFQCNVCTNGEYGLRDKVVKLSLTSSQPYNGIGAGSNLNGLFRLADERTYSSSTVYMPLDSLGHLMNNGGSRSVQPFRVISGTKPGNLLQHKLTLKLEFQSGKVINAPSPDFVWN